MIRSDDGDPKRRRLLLQALASGFFSGGLVGRCAFAADVFSRRPSKLPEGQSIYRISGDVRVNGNTADLKTRIGPNDTLETAKDGEIVFVVGRNAFVQRGSTRVVLQGAPRQSALIDGLRLLTGALLSVFPRGRPLALTTPTATIGIRGSGAYLESDPERTYFCTCYGIADIAAANDPQSTDTVAAKHHDRPVYILRDGQPGQNIRSAPFVNHTDQELMLIETLVGRTVPFVFPKDDYRAPRRKY